MENRSQRTKAIVDAGIISGIIIVITLITGYIPIMAGMGSLILPVPIAILYIRHGYKISFEALIVSIIVTAMILNPLTAVLSGITSGSAGFALGYCIDKKKKVSTIILFLACASILSTIIVFFITLVFVEKTSMISFLTKSVSSIVDLMKQNFESTKAFYAQAGISKDQLQQLQQMEQMLNTVLTVNFIFKVLVGLLVVASAFMAYFEYWISSIILKKLRYEVPTITPFSEIYIPNILGAVIIIFVCLGIILTSKNIIPIGEYIQNSSMVIAQYAFSIDGIAVVVYFLRRKYQVSKGILAVILIITLISQLNTMYFFIGIFDVVMNFRKLDPNGIRRV